MMVQMARTAIAGATWRAITVLSRAWHCRGSNRSFPEFEISFY